MKAQAKPSSEWASNRDWMLSAWYSVQNGVKRFAEHSGWYEVEERDGGNRMKASPVMEATWIKGQLVVMGRNQTMKMLIQSSSPTPRRSLFGFRQKVTCQQSPDTSIVSSR